MDAHRRSWFDDRGLALASGARIPFYAGALHYWRVPPARWAACLKAIHDLGLTIVETYVPWRVHAPSAGAYDWRGPRDLRAFLAAAHAAGLRVVLRPGPHVNAELTSFGMPDWVLAETACQARTARDTPAWMPSPPRAWPIPSYASAAFAAHVRTWYAAFADQIRDQLAPDGPVVAIGVDNEAQMFFRLGAYDLDYHPDALAWWAEDGHGEAPRAWDPARAAACVAWVRWKERYTARALGAFAAMLDDAGLGGVARFHNLPPGPHALYDLRAVQTAIGGPVGIDAYTPRAQFTALRRRALACVGSATPIPLGCEVGVGFMPWLPPLDQTAPLDGKDDPMRERDHLVALLAAGLRGFNVYMAVERDRWHAAAISEDGRVEQHAAWLRPLVAALGEVEWPTLRSAPAIALVACKADARFGLASSMLDPLTPVVAELLALGPGGALELGADPAAITARRWHDAVARALELAQVPYVIVDEATPVEQLATYRAVIAPTPGARIDRELWLRLRTLADGRRTRVVIGPLTPVRDELDHPLADVPLRGLGRLAAASLDDVAGLADDLAALAGEPTDSWHVERPDDVRARAYSDPSGAMRCVFVVSDAERATQAVLLAEDHVLRDVFSQEVLRVAAGRVQIAMPPRGVRMFVIER